NYIIFFDPSIPGMRVDRRSAAARDSPGLSVAEGRAHSAHPGAALPPAFPYAACVGGRRRLKGSGQPRTPPGAHRAAPLRAWPQRKAGAARPPRPARQAWRTSLIRAEPAVRPWRSRSVRPVPKWPPSGPSVLRHGAGGNNSVTDPGLGGAGERRGDSAGRRG
ncbi:unnamed protein product, partial [Coccothraustes coccothraustes]